MFKVLYLLSLLGTAAALTANQITTLVNQLQASKPALMNQNAFSNANSYQSKARGAAATNLANVANVDANQVRQYYAAACIYFATYQVGNPRVTQLLGNAGLPAWKDKSEWLSNPNYCKWYGIACYNSLTAPTTWASQESNKIIIEINLSSNNLYGQFPNEIALLGDNLIAIDLFSNVYHWTNDYRWMRAMVKLEALFFGTTAWDTFGIPLDLRFLTELQELDMSNSFWRGELTDNAFNNLKKLRYLDMGQNFYDYSKMDTIPTAISALPVLTNLYVDNLQPLPGTFLNTDKLSLSFLPKMRNIIEMWMDYTNVRGPIPTTIGNAKTLQSFSVVYCKLTGTIPNSIVNTNIDRMWLYGNPGITGVLPTGFASLDWRFLYLEGTKIASTLPKALCDQVGTDDTKDLLELGAECNICPTGCCTCCGSGCNNIPPPTPAPTFVICFSGDSMVDVENEGLTKMSQLSLGDSVKVGDNKYEPIYSFGHISADDVAEYVAIYAEGNRKLELSEDHMVAVEGGRFLPASLVQVGDKLVTASGDLAEVHSIRSVSRKGLYAPFTASGSIVVNDILASNYVAFQGSEHVVIAGFEIPMLNYHWMAHVFNSVHRIAYKLGLTTESYTEYGTSQWVHTPRLMGLWLLEQNPVVMIAGLIPYVLFFSVTSLVEMGMNVKVTVLATVIAGFLTLFTARRSVFVKMV